MATKTPRMHRVSASNTETWSIYYFDKNTGKLRCMERQLPSNMSKQGISDYITRMGHRIDKAISDEIIYTY